MPWSITTPAHHHTHSYTCIQKKKQIKERGWEGEEGGNGKRRKERRRKTNSSKDKACYEKSQSQTHVLLKGQLKTDVAKKGEKKTGQRQKCHHDIFGNYTLSCNQSPPLFILITIKKNRSWK